MQHTVKQFAAVLLFFFCLGTVRATHIVGGELNYYYLGGDNYLVSLKVMRDCFSSTTPFDRPASIGVFDANNTFLFQVLINPEDETQLENTTNSPCLIAPNNVCYEIAYYTDTIVLPPHAGGYQLAYQRCCRNNSVANIANVAATGATYYATVPDRTIAPANSNPYFVNLPSTFICRNTQFVFDNRAVDPDGDSLVYQLCVPFDGATQTLPNPQPPANPPYTNIVWQSPYNFANPLGGIPLAINSSTGLLTAKPAYIGQFVYGVSVKEYRNGVYLGETRRDFQVNVLNCPKIVNAIMTAPLYQCGNMDVSFINKSTGAISYKWDFGDTTTLGDTSLLAAPQYHYPDTGQYSVMLVAVSNFNSSCRDTLFKNVKLYPQLVADFQHDVTACNDTIAFTDQTSLNNGPITNWDWDFGDGVHVHLPNPTHAYGVGGNYLVKLNTVSQRGCADTMERTIQVPLLPAADFQAFTDSCHPEVSFINRSRLASFYQWNLGDDNTASTTNVSHIYDEEGPYDITLIAGSISNCYDTTTSSIDYQQFEFLGHYIPNSFTPNGDGKNDIFMLSGATICEEVEMIIYDRWGKPVYETTDLSRGWDGTSHHKAVDPGVYVYFLQGKDYSRKGTITVIR